MILIAPLEYGSKGFNWISLPVNPEFQSESNFPECRTCPPVPSSILGSGGLDRSHACIIKSTQGKCIISSWKVRILLLQWTFWPKTKIFLIKNNYFCHHPDISASKARTSESELFHLLSETTCTWYLRRWAVHLTKTSYNWSRNVIFILSLEFIFASDFDKIYFSRKRNHNQWIPKYWVSFLW